MNELKIGEIVSEHLKASILPEDVQTYMWEMINEEPPSNPSELFELIKDFLSDGMVYSNTESHTLCEQLFKALIAGGLNPENKDTLVANVLSRPIILNELLEEHKEGDEAFLDPFLGMKKSQRNYNTFEENIWDSKSKLKLQRQLSKQEKLEQNALDKKIAEFAQIKAELPKPKVKHNMGGGIKDIIINNLSVSIGGKTLLDSTLLRLQSGKKYGLIGRNGIGKTTLLNQIAKGAIEDFPLDVHVLHVEQELEGTEQPILDAVLQCDEERTQLMEEEKTVSTEIHNLLNDSSAKAVKKSNDLNVRLTQIYTRLTEIEAETAPQKAKDILKGLGFGDTEFSKSLNEFSGGWRMRVALAQVLFVGPDLLLLDEPTNHLDIDAIMWLEDYILASDKTCVVVSHARDFLNNISSEIIHFFDFKLHNYKGNYDNFEKVRSEKIRRTKKQHEAQDKQLSHMQEFIDKFRYNAKRASLVQSRIKALDKMDIIDEIATDPECIFIFPQSTDSIRPPLLRLDEAAIGYESGKPIVKGVNFYVDMESRICIVGPNGAGKTTLIKGLVGDLSLQDGFYYKHGRLRVGLFTQHHVEQLELKLSPVEQMMKVFPDNHSETFRMHLGSFGISGNLSLRPMYLLSGGQKSRVAFALITFIQPHIIILDEPTNHLDIDAVTALAIALNNFNGGLVVVSHDAHFVSIICNQIYVVRHGKVKCFDGDFKQYKSLYAKKKRLNAGIID